jgi:hypothetical protein
VVQTNIRGNHVAIVDVGRAGPTARIRLDSNAAVMADDIQPRFDGVPVMDELKKALDAALADAAAQKSRADVATAALEAVKADADREKARADAAEDKLTAAEKARADAAATFDARVNARVELCANAKRVLGDDFKMDMTDKAIRAAVVTKLTGRDVSERSDAYVDAAYDHAIENATDAATATAATRVAAVAPKQDAASRLDAERAKMIEANRNAWQSN